MSPNWINSGYIISSSVVVRRLAQQFSEKKRLCLCLVPKAANVGNSSDYASLYLAPLSIKCHTICSLYPLMNNFSPLAVMFVGI